jgi:NAD(P)H-flavin reductase
MSEALDTSEIRSGAPARGLSPMTPTVVRVRRYRRETEDTFTLAIDMPAGCSFAPGQFHMLYVFGVGEIPISIGGGSAERRELIVTIRAVGSVTTAMSRLRDGSALGLRGPFGSSWPLEAAEGTDVVLVAGGMGLVPLRPVVQQILKHRRRYGRVTLLYGARTPRDMLFFKELEKWRGRFDCQVQVTVDQADLSWHGHVGVVTTLFNQVELDPSRTIGMICGPEVMMRFTLREFGRRGVPDDRLYLSMERNMQCAVGLCGHCQFGPSFVCMDGPVFRFDRIKTFFNVREA